MKRENIIVLCNGDGKLYRHLTAVLLIVVLFLICSLERGYAASQDVKDLCLECHEPVRKLMNKPVVHKPVAEGNCTACHNPHVSRHSGLLSESSSDLCYKCHELKKGFNGEVIHKPVEEGKCLACHDPHSSEKAFLLEKRGGEICFSCHPKTEIMAKKNIHPEVKKGKCTSCHSPHSTDFDNLLINDRRKICNDCHYPSNGKPTYPCRYKVVGSDCSGCHSPHSSEREGLLRANLHEPFESEKCDTCHKNGKSYEINREIENCLECHKKTLESFYKLNSHLIAGSNSPCTTCHNPHASDHNNLMTDKIEKICYDCHYDSADFVEKSEFSHPELGSCSDCHISHGSNSRYFLSSGSQTCSTENCHSSQGTFVHPVGEDVIDPRTNSSMDCITCHNAMGSPEKFILRFEKDRELCIQCHPG